MHRSDKRFLTGSKRIEVMHDLDLFGSHDVIGPLTIRFVCFFTQFFADHTNGRAYATGLRLSSVVCDVMYRG